MTIYSLYVSGDQIPYANFFNSLDGASLSEALLLQVTFLSAGEPFSALIIWFGANLGMSQNVFFSLLNSFLFILILHWLNINRVSFLSTFLILFGYYVFVLMFSAERLKFAVIFLLLGIIVNNRSSILFLIISLLNHFSIILLIPSMVLTKFYSKNIQYFLNIKYFVYFFISIILFFVFWPIFNLNVLNKISDTNTSENIFDFFSFSIMFFSLVTSNKSLNYQFYISMLPFIFFIYLMGPTRVNMLCYMFYLWYFVHNNLTNNLIFKGILIYNFLKSFYFLFNVYKFGTGFVI